MDIGAMRRQKFEELESCPYHGKVMRKLKAAELALCHAFLIQHGGLDKGEFEMAAARWFLDMPEKPKRLQDMVELLTAANARAFR